MRKRFRHFRLELRDLERVDGKYNVGALVELAHPWVSAEEAEEILAIHNAEYDAVMELVEERLDTESKGDE